MSAGSDDAISQEEFLGKAVKKGWFGLVFGKVIWNPCELVLTYTEASYQNSGWLLGLLRGRLSCGI
jgi:hypothetical protein